MARIRSLKPEAFQSETLAEVSVEAERTFFGLTTIVDDRGRIADKPAQINGELWSMRGGHTAADLDGELEVLGKTGDQLICRYTGCDGKRYLHLVTWDRHQKIDHPSKIRLPRCPHHLLSITGRAEECGLHEGNCPPARETLASPRESSRGIKAGSGKVASLAGEPAGTSTSSEDGDKKSTPPDQQESESSRNSREPSRDVEMYLGPRTVDLGSRTVPPSAGAAKPRRETDADSDVTTGTLVAEWIRSCRKRPPDRVIGQVSGELKKLLNEQHDAEDIRAGLTAWALAAKHPSTLASFVNEAMNGRPRNNGSPARPSTTDQRIAQGQAVKAALAARQGDTHDA